MNDINNFTITLELLETDDEIIYEVVEKTNPKEKYTLKILKHNEDMSNILNLLYKTNSDRSDSLKLQVFPKIYSDFNCLEKGSKKINRCLLFENVPNSLKGVLLQEDQALVAFSRIYRFYQAFVNALGYLEINGLYHGSLNPDTIGLSLENGLKFMDFEKFKQGFEEYEEEELLEKGKSRYLAPELKKPFFERKKTSFNGNKVDVFAMGVILLELGNEEISEYTKLGDLKEEIAVRVRKFREKFENKLDFQYIDIFQSFMLILERVLSIDPNTRPLPLELLKKSMQFINKKYLITVLKTIEENSGDLKENLKRLFILIQRLYDEKRFSSISAFQVQSNPNKALCEGSPEMNYFWHVLFKRIENETGQNLSFSIENQANYLNGISNEILSVLLNSFELCQQLESLRLCFGSWLDLTTVGIKKIADFLQKIPFTRLKKLEIGVYAHSVDSLCISDLTHIIIKGLKASGNQNLEALTFFVDTSFSQDQSLSNLSEIIKFEPNLKDLSLHFRQITKSANFLKLDESFSIKMLSGLRNLKFGLASTIEPYVDDALVLKFYEKMKNGLAGNGSLNSLGIYLMSWGEINKTFFVLNDLLRDGFATLDFYFYGKTPEKADENELHKKFKEALKKAKLNSFNLEFAKMIKDVKK